MHIDPRSRLPRRAARRFSGMRLNAGRTLLLAACAALGVSVVPHVQAAQDAAGVALYQRLGFGSASAEHAMAIDLSPRAWAVGQPGGPTASEAQLRAVLAQLAGIEIGGRCANGADNPSARDCTFALAPPDFAGIVVKDQRGDTSLGWVATTSGAARDAPANSKQDFDAMRYFGLLAPERFVAKPIAPRGARLALRYRAVAGDLLPAGLDRTSASLILRGREHGAAPVPTAAE